ncbi:TatD family hydrolase [bacterium]|nr:TatD family hydrolase [bacterium]
MIDSHAHLDLDEYKNDLDKVIESAKKAGVEYIINIATCIESSKKTLELTKKYDCIYGAVGVHPHDVETISENMIADLSEMLKEDKIVALGEVGLDYYKNLSPKDLQKNGLLDF